MLQLRAYHQRQKNCTYPKYNALPPSLSLHNFFGIICLQLQHELQGGQKPFKRQPNHTMQSKFPLTNFSSLLLINICCVTINLTKNLHLLFPLVLYLSMKFTKIARISENIPRILIA